MRDYRRYEVWNKAHQLTKKIYRDTSGFPCAEMYGLTSQLRRACSSIPTNIAEGCGRDGNLELARFLVIAMGSAKEADYLLFLSRELGYMESRVFHERSGELFEVERMLGSLIRKIKATN